MTQQVVFFSSCLVEHIYPQVGLDSVALLKHCGFEVLFPKFQSCCAQPAYNSGAKDQAQEVAKQTIDLLSEYDLPVVVPSASCADMIKKHFPLLMKEDSHYSMLAENLSERSFELIQFISPFLPSMNDEKEPIALHVSCSARRGTKSEEFWITSLQNSGHVVDQPNYQNECCGFGGTFSVKAPEISSVMAEDKCKSLMALSPTFTSGDCGCLMHLNGYADKNKLALKGRHIVSILAERYGVSNAR